MNDNGKAEKKDIVREIAAGELQIVLASEEVNRRNIMMIVDYSQRTRKMTRDLAEEVLHLRNQILTFQTLVEHQNKRIASLLQVISNKGTTDEG